MDKQVDVYYTLRYLSCKLAATNKSLRISFETFPPGEVLLS